MSVPAKAIGLTGGIGSGKTTVAQMLEELGAVVIHADTVGHEVYRPNSVGWCRVTAVFGSDIVGPDQAIDRKKLGALVFANPDALRQLNAIVHPLIFEEMRRRIDGYRAQGVSQPIVVEAAVLIEANWLPLVDEVWLVTASKEVLVDRVTRQRGLSPEEVATRIEAQLSDAERRRYAQVIIENTGSIDELRRQVQILWERTRNAVA
jgi:dephospho-CoA kinase